MNLYAEFKYHEIGTITSSYGSQSKYLKCHCGAFSSGSTIPTGWTVSKHVDDVISMVSDGHSCREYSFGYLYSLAQYVKEPLVLELRGIEEPGPFAPTLEALMTAIWLGMTDQSDRISYRKSNIVILPAKMLDQEVFGCSGPLYSIISWFAKAGQLVNTASPELVEGVGNILKQSKEGGLTADDRRQLTRLSVDFLWNRLDGRSGSSDYYAWAKYLTIWHSLGGMNFLTNDNGFGYRRLSKSDYRNLSAEHKYCNHNTSQYTAPAGSRSWNGSRTFYSAFFNRVIDGRSVDRFLKGGNGMTKGTAVKYLKEGWPWRKESSS